MRVQWAPCGAFWLLHAQGTSDLIVGCVRGDGGALPRWQRSIDGQQKMLKSWICFQCENKNYTTRTISTYIL
jgi:hypothetical protein